MKDLVLPATLLALTLLAFPSFRRRIRRTLRRAAWAVFGWFVP